MVGALNIDGLLFQAQQNVAVGAEGNRLAKANLAGKVVHSEEHIHEVAVDFESVFLNQVLKDMFKEIEVDSMFGGGYAEEVYREMLHQHYADNISEAGGLGIAEHVKAQLIRLQEATTGGGHHAG